MGILEEAAGAFAAVEAEKKLNPNGNVLEEGLAGIAGFEGAKKLEEHFEEKKEEEQGQ
jgi:hypothetical protein